MKHYDSGDAFAEYWNEHGQTLETLGIEENKAKMIFCSGFWRGDAYRIDVEEGRYEER